MLDSGHLVLRGAIVGGEKRICLDMRELLPDNLASFSLRLKTPTVAELELEDDDQLKLLGLSSRLAIS